MNHSLLLTTFCLLTFTNVEAKNLEHFNPTQKALYSNNDQRYNIAERGAVGDGKTLNTKAIQAVIDECTKNGGGTIIIPKGIFISGAIFLKPCGKI